MKNVFFALFIALFFAPQAKALTLSQTVTFDNVQNIYNTGHFNDLVSSPAFTADVALTTCGSLNRTLTFPTIATSSLNGVLTNDIFQYKNGITIVHATSTGGYVKFDWDTSGLPSDYHIYCKTHFIDFSEDNYRFIDAGSNTAQAPGSYNYDVHATSSSVYFRAMATNFVGSNTQYFTDNLTPSGIMLSIEEDPSVHNAWIKQLSSGTSTLNYTISLANWHNQDLIFYDGEQEPEIFYSENQITCNSFVYVDVEYLGYEENSIVSWNEYQSTPFSTSTIGELISDPNEFTIRYNNLQLGTSSQNFFIEGGNSTTEYTLVIDRRDCLYTSEAITSPCSESNICNDIATTTLGGNFECALKRFTCWAFQPNDTSTNYILNSVDGIKTVPPLVTIFEIVEAIQEGAENYELQNGTLSVPMIRATATGTEYYMLPTLTASSVPNMIGTENTTLIRNSIVWLAYIVSILGLFSLVYTNHTKK